MNADDLQDVIDRELRDLPAPRAPQTLLPRVLAATVGRKPAPWYARPWLEWPRVWQVASATVLVATGVGLAMLMEAALRVPAIVDAATLMRVLWHLLVEPVAAWLLVGAVCLSLACAVIWSALERGASGGTSHQ